MAALLTSTSRRPNASSVAATTAAQSSSLDTSWRIPRARSPMSATTSASSFSRTSVTMTAAPSAANSRASASPCPRAPPVMSAVLPASRPVMLVMVRERNLEPMDVRNVETVAPEVEHNGTVPVWWLIRPREMKEITDGGFLELANEFEVAVGGEVFPHSHPTHEFYFVMTGRGVMTVAGEARDVHPGDLIHIPPD